MRHARPEDLDQIEELLGEVRKFSGLTERKRGSFYHRSAGFLHFHEDPAGMFADLKIDGEFQRFRVSTRAERIAFLREIRKALAPRAAQSRDTRRAE